MYNRGALIIMAEAGVDPLADQVHLTVISSV